MAAVTISVADKPTLDAVNTATTAINTSVGASGDTASQTGNSV